MADNNRSARRSLGQNFLANKGLLKKMVLSVSCSGSPTVVEVGPGLGHLTVLLCQFYKQVVAIEKDETLAADLRMKFSDRANLTVISGDASRVSVKKLLETFPGNYDAVGNLPFYCATEILFNFLEEEKTAGKIVFMFQKEVAERLLAKPRSKTYGALTVAGNSLSSVKSLFSVKAGSFYPRPDVDAEVLEFEPKIERLSLEERSCLREILKAAFSGRRKTLKNAFKKGGLWDEMISCQKVDLERLVGIRPDAISSEDYFGLARALAEERRR